MESLLEVNDLKVHFPITKGILSRTAGYVYAVDGVSFALGAGETLGIVGESGCGKTTTGLAILRLIEPTDGRIVVDGQDVNTILELMQAIDDKSAGDDVLLEVQHCETTQEVTVSLDEQNGHIYLGLQMSRSPQVGIWPLERGSIIVQADKPAFVITQVIPGSPADQAGLRRSPGHHRISPGPARRKRL